MFVERVYLIIKDEDFWLFMILKHLINVRLVPFVVEDIYESSPWTKGFLDIDINIFKTITNSMQNIDFWIDFRENLQALHHRLRYLTETVVPTLF